MREWFYPVLNIKNLSNMTTGEFFGRFGKLAIGNSRVGNAMSWDRIGDSDNHLPERFTRVSFSTLTTPADKRCDC